MFKVVRHLIKVRIKSLSALFFFFILMDLFALDRTLFALDRTSIKNYIENKMTKMEKKIIKLKINQSKRFGFGLGFYPMDLIGSYHVSKSCHVVASHKIQCIGLNSFPKIRRYIL